MYAVWLTSLANASNSVRFKLVWWRCGSVCGGLKLWPEPEPEPERGEIDREEKKNSERAEARIATATTIQHYALLMCLYSMAELKPKP